LTRSAQTLQEAGFVTIPTVPASTPACLAALLTVAAPAFAQAEPAADKPPKATAEVAAGTPVLVLPLQPIYRSAEQDKASTTTKLLERELDRNDAIRVLRGGTILEGQTAPTMEAANTAQTRAERAEAEHRIDDAIDARRETIAGIKSAAAALEDPTRFIMAHHELARALMWSARDDEARDVMLTAGRMDPNLELPADQFSRLYRARFRALRGQLRQSPRGELLVRSVLPGATIHLDGREMGVAPIKLTGLIPGVHVLSASADGVPDSHVIVETGTRKAAETTVAFGETVGGVTVGAVSDAVAENSLPAAAVAAARKAGQVAGARYVVLGGLARVLDVFKLHTFVLDVDAGSMTRIEPHSLDLALLTAASDIGVVVTRIERQVDAFDGSVTSVASIEKNIRPSKVVSVQDASPDLSKRRKKKKTGPARKHRGPIQAVQDLDIRD
jgi:hypothetical protein